MPQSIAVLGAGSWGTALAIALARLGHDVMLWGRESQNMALMQQKRCNSDYLPDCIWPDSLTASQDFAHCVAQPNVLVAVPSHAFRPVITQWHHHQTNPQGVAWCTKGLEHDSGLMLHQVVASVFGSLPMAAISGPSFAKEVASGLPTAMTVAGDPMDYAHHWQQLFFQPSLRLYSSNDLAGVAVGGALKNILAIAAGISDGLGFGANARAALITRGLIEIQQVSDCLGGQRDTLQGLAGMGDLVLTCTDRQSRNWRFGYAVGQGYSADEAHQQIGQVVEGVAAAATVQQLMTRRQLELPILTQVYNVLYQQLSPRQAVQALLNRTPTSE